MLERTSSAAVGAADPGIRARRAVVAALNAATMAGLLWLAAVALSPGGYGFLDCMLLGLFAVTLPWTMVGYALRASAISQSRNAFTLGRCRARCG